MTITTEQIVRLHKVNDMRTPHYQIVIEGQIVADVYRTGSLPSCQCWETVIRRGGKALYEARSGREWKSPLRSRHTRTEAVDDFAKAYTSA